MLIDCTIQGKAVLSLAAGKDKEHIDNTLLIGNKRYLKTAAMYGPNASGKTNLIRALSTAILTVRHSNLYQINQQLNMTQFLLDSDSKEKPSSFEFIISVEGIKYVYGFKATSEHVVEEYLYEYITSWPSKVFERKNIDQYDFSTDKSELETLAKRNAPNKLFLATATSWNYQRTRKVFEWFEQQIDTYDHASWNPTQMGKYLQDKSGELASFTRRILEIADSNIKDFHVTMDENPLMKSYQTRIIHHVNHIDTSNIDVNFTLDMESAGTQMLFYMSPHIKEALETGRILVIDEIDNSLHPLLATKLIILFHNPDTNIGNGQLIFNTHDVNLLSLELFRRDQIYFFEKNRETASSEIFSLDEFSARKSENIRNGYLIGRYGAIPNIGTGDLLWQTEDGTSVKKVEAK